MESQVIPRIEVHHRDFERLWHLDEPQKYLCRFHSLQLQNLEQCLLGLDISSQTCHSLHKQALLLHQLLMKQAASQLKVFRCTETLSTGWQLVSSKVGEEVTLVYAKNGRFATIYLSPKDTVQGFVTGDYGSDIDISVVHPDAIGVQNPYDELQYEELPDSP